jgi:hypothetical protein
LYRLPKVKNTTKFQKKCTKINKCARNIVNHTSKLPKLAAKLPERTQINDHPATRKTITGATPNPSEPPAAESPAHHPQTQAAAHTPDLPLQLPRHLDQYRQVPYPPHQVPQSLELPSQSSPPSKLQPTADG